ncbi:MAG: DUF881 domain-containing protein [Dehalococcoidia bacterium]
MSGRSARLSLTVVCLLLGVLLVAQFRTQRGITTALLAASSTDQALIINNLVESNTELREEVEALRSQLLRYQEADGQGVLQTLVNELNRIKIVNGLIEVSGPGVQVCIDGRISVLDMQDMVNELRNTGAEAMAVNGQRLIVSSVIASDDRGMIVNGVRISEPYIFQVIGHQETMAGALTRKGGLIALLEARYEGLDITVSKRDKIILSIYRGSFEFRYATAVK